jgi:3-methyladenine DNA glycosylase/8-oxoguanine DNA glycosylase
MRARTRALGRAECLRTALETDVVPAGAYRLPTAGRDGVLVSRNGALARVVYAEGEAAVVRAWAASGCVRFRAEAPSRGAALAATERMRFALGTDHDLGDFHRRFRFDALVGPVIHRRPWVRPRRRPEPFEALAWAVCEQLVEGPRAAAIERRIVRRLGRRSACGELRAPPSAERLAACAPAELDACGPAHKRSIALIKVAREVASGRADLAAHEPTWRRLLEIPNIGNWTIEMLAFEGQGRDDMLPALDVAYLKLVGALTGLGRRATEDEVRGFFAPYEEHAGLAGVYALHRGYI